jgi:hypothetical protein
MPIANREVYAAMLDAAKQGSFAYPAINISSSQTLNAALQGFAEAGSDGIVQVSTGASDLDWCTGPYGGAALLRRLFHRPSSPGHPPRTGVTYRNRRSGGGRDDDLLHT